MMIFERDIAIDLGTTNIRVFVRGKGIMLREPSIVAVDKYTGRMLKVGQDAQKMLGRTPGSIIAMPGLPKAPAALNIDVDDNGQIVGLF